MDVLGFQLDRNDYALPVASVREIVRATAIVPLPKAPLVIEGVINLRGEIVPVLDLRARFGAPRRSVHPDEHFIVLRAGERTIALRADQATGLRAVDDAQVRPIEAVVANTEYVAGLATLPDGVLLIADPEAFLSEAESAILNAALGAAPLDSRSKSA